MFDNHHLIERRAGARRKAIKLTSSGALVLILALLMLASCSDQASDATTASEATVIEPDKATEESPPTIPPTKEPDIVPEATIVATEDAAPVTTLEDREETATPVSTDTPEPPQVETVEPTAELDSGGILEEIEAIRAEIEANVVEVRGLEPKDPFVVTLLSREDLRQRIDEELLSDYTAEDARNDAIVM
ncbi:MAG: hypothetical protein WA996_17800, partial [Candidatus Promineifilaceae bacterium]